MRDALVFEFVPSARIENLCRVHLAKICAGCTWYKFVRGALVANLCPVHLLQIHVYLYIFGPFALRVIKSRRIQRLLVLIWVHWRIFCWFSCWNRVLRSILVRGGPSETGTRASVLTEPVINWSPRALRLSRAVAMSAREFRRLRSPHWLASGNQWSIVG